jgi:sulfate transport system ATP-binding protein
MRHELFEGAGMSKDGAPPWADLGHTPASVTVNNVEKQFGRFPALKGVSLDIRAGELIALLGPSGSGKTTLLRLIAGLDFPDGGGISFGGQDVTFTKAAERGVGFVFQQYALFKHMTVAKNVAFGLDVRRRAQRPSRTDRKMRVDALLELVELGGLGDRYPSQLSGGQRQRVALARALAVSPKILLLDEPFGALDATVRKTLRRELRRIHDTTGVTTVFVTHDQEEALDLADRVALLNHGQIEQVGRPQEVLDAPASPFVAGFVGQANKIAGEVRGGVFHALGASLAAKAVADGPAIAFVRPDQFVLANDAASIEVVLARVTPRGPILWLECLTQSGSTWDVALTRRDGSVVKAAGQSLRLAFDGGYVFAATAG